MYAHSTTVLHQLLALLPEQQFQTFVGQHEADKYVKRFATQCIGYRLKPFGPFVKRPLIQTVIHSNKGAVPDFRRRITRAASAMAKAESTAPPVTASVRALQWS